MKLPKHENMTIQGQICYTKKSTMFKVHIHIYVNSKRKISCLDGTLIRIYALPARGGIINDRIVYLYDSI